MLKYVALLSQNGTDNPVAIVKENSLNLQSDWMRDQAGASRIDAHGMFPEGRTVLSVGSVTPADDGYLAVADLFSVENGNALILTVNTWFPELGFKGTDSGLKLTRVEITVYPA